jgi:hypothetical protein
LRQTALAGVEGNRSSPRGERFLATRRRASIVSYVCLCPGRIAVAAQGRNGRTSLPQSRVLNRRIAWSKSIMNCQQLAACIERLQPDAMPRDVARLCLLLTNYIEDLGSLENQEQLTEAWQQMGMRLQLATDQHAAMTEELEQLAESDPRAFDMEQIWVLIRAIKVQSQVLQLYVGTPVLDV